MRSPNSPDKSRVPTQKVELELEAKIVEALQAMEAFTKIPKAEIVTTAVKRFIATHKDYFPEGYQNG